METFYYGSVSGQTFLFCFLSIIAVLIGFIIYGCCAYPQYRRIPFRDWKPSRRISLILGGGLTLGLLTLFYCSTWLQFYRIEVGAEKVRLRYAFPDRTVELHPSEVRELKLGITTHKFEDHRLVIYTRTGEKYESANVNPKVYYKNLDGINKILR